MLLKGGLGAPPPPSLDIVIMQKIRAEQERRIYRKVVALLVLKIVAVFALVAIAGVVLWANIGRPDWGGVGEHFAVAGLWIKDHPVIVAGGMIIMVFGGIFQLRRA